MKAPATLQEAIIYFADADNCFRYMVAHRWPDGVACPACGRTDVSYLRNQRKFQCKSAHAKRQFTVKVGTIFEDSPLGLDKWLPAVWIIVSAKNGVSSCEIARTLGVTQKTAWFMLHRIRKAMQTGSLMKMGGNGGAVEVDETFIGGKARNMHITKKQRRITGTGGKDKTAVMASSSGAGTSAPSSFRIAASLYCRLRFASTLKLALRSIPTSCSPTKGWLPTTRIA